MIDQTGKMRLSEYDLWLDGCISVFPEHVKKYIRTCPHDKLFVTDSQHPSIKQFNQLSDFRLVEKDGLDADVIDPSFKLPPEYTDLNVMDYLLSLESEIPKDDLYQERIMRLRYEIEVFRLRDLFDIVKLLKYVIDTFDATNTVWGVGRGSSCSSYILFLMGLHLVDVVRYDIDLHDFIK